MPTLPVLIGSVVALVILMGIATGVLRLYGVPHVWSPLLAVLRGAVQLALISVILAGVITSPLWVGVALLVMFTVATLTAGRRLGGGMRRTGIVAAAMGGGILITLAVVFATGAIEFAPRYALAIGGIVIGNAMSIATLTGRRLTELTIDRWAEVEGWFALGATPRRSTRDFARLAVHSALIPSIDQTKTTGLVTLPGAFVGAIFGGLAPLDAGRFQIVVLVAVMAAGAITGVVVAALLSPVKVKPLALA